MRIYIHPHLLCWLQKLVHYFFVNVTKIQKKISQYQWVAGIYFFRCRKLNGKRMAVQNADSHSLSWNTHSSPAGSWGSVSETVLNSTSEQMGCWLILAALNCLACVVSAFRAPVSVWKRSLCKSQKILIRMGNFVGCPWDLCPRPICTNLACSRNDRIWVPCLCQGAGLNLLLSFGQLPGWSCQ